MLEFLAGISVGALLGLIIGLLLPEFIRRTDSDSLPPPQREVVYLPAGQPQPFPYQPPVIVLAAPRANGVVSVEQSTSLTRRARMC